MKKSKGSPSNRARPSRSLPLGLAGTVWLALLWATVSGCGLVGGGGSAATVRSPDGAAMTLAYGLYQRGESLATLAARGGASYTKDNRRNYFKFEALVMKPGRLLFTALDPTGRPAFRLASDGYQLTGILYGARQYAVGPATAENFARFIPLGISPDQLIALMSGSQVKPAEAGARQVGDSTELVILPEGVPDGDANLWRVRLAGGLEQDPESARVQSAALGSARNPDLTIKYLSVKDVSREDLAGRLEPFPHIVDISWNDRTQAAPSQSLRVTYEEVRLGLPLDVGAFALPRPDGFELVQLY